MDPKTPNPALPTAAPGSATVPQKKVTESPKMSRKVIIGSGVSPETLLKLDAEGVDLQFEQTDKFLALTEDLVAQLSRTNKLRYELAKDFHDTWRGEEHEKFVEKFKIDRQNVGSATDKLTIKADPSLHTRWVRPDNKERCMALGYKVLEADEATSYLGPQGGTHQISKLGQTELVAMAIPKELFEKRQREKVARNNELAGAWEGIGNREIAATGAGTFKPVDEAKDRSHRWEDLGPEG